MVLETLRYADEVQKAQGYFREIADTTPDAELLDLAEAHRLGPRAEDLGAAVVLWLAGGLDDAW